jgi:hypothetical protein
MRNKAWILQSFGREGHHGLLFVRCCYNTLQNTTQYTIEPSNKIVCNKNLYTSEVMVVVVVVVRPLSHRSPWFLLEIQVSNERGHMSNILFP